MKRLTMLFAILFLSVLPQVSFAADPRDNALIQSVVDTHHSDGGTLSKDLENNYGGLFMVGNTTKKDIMDTFSHVPASSGPWTFPHSKIQADILTYQHTKNVTTYQLNFFFYKGSQKLCGYALGEIEHNFFSPTKVTQVGGMTHDQLVKSCGTQSKQ